jgi:hypothetical protein
MPLVLLQEDESKKLGTRRIEIPSDLMSHLNDVARRYSDKQYKPMRGYKRLHSIVDSQYNDKDGSSDGEHNASLSFADAKRIDFDIKHMSQSEDNPEYSMIGGDRMKNFISSSLRSLRNGVKKVSKVPEVPKLSTKDVKPDNIKNTVKVNGRQMTVEEFSRTIKLNL